MPDEPDPTIPPARRKRNPRAGKSPSFQFYPADWLADAQVRAMNLEERGAYIDLLAYCWREGSIPTDVAEIARLLQVDDARAARLWERLRPRFNADGTQRRLDIERRKQRTFSRLQSERRMTGLRNARERKQLAVDRTPTEAQPESTLHSAFCILHSAEGGRAGSSARDGDLPQGENSSPGGDDRALRLASLARWREEFDRLWKAHPPRRGTKANKPKAWEAYRALRPSPELAGAIVAGHERARASESWGDGFVPDLHRWLRAKGWEDEQGVVAGPGWKERFLARGEEEEE